MKTITYKQFIELSNKHYVMWCCELAGIMYFVNGITLRRSHGADEYILEKENEFIEICNITNDLFLTNTDNKKITVSILTKMMKFD